MLVSIVFWQTDRELYHYRPRCQPDSSFPLAMGVPEWLLFKNLRKTEIPSQVEVSFSRIMREPHAASARYPRQGLGATGGGRRGNPAVVEVSEFRLVRAPA